MLVPIACRFVPYDQWLLTHLEDDFKVKQIKHWILSKCNLARSPGSRIQRPVSPITFAPSIRPRSSLDSLDDGYNEDDEFSDQELLLRHTVPSKDISFLDAKPGPSSQSVQSGSYPLVDQCILLSFSTGIVLEDEFTLSWYHLHPYELLEIHPAGVVAPLQRDVLAEYIQPYFQAKVRVLRAIWNHRSGRFEPPCIDTAHEHGGCQGKDRSVHILDTSSPGSSTLHSDKRRKTKVDWKARWVIINHGVLSLCKEHVTSSPVHQFALSTAIALRGTDALERAFSVATPRVICIKFRLRTSFVACATSPPSSSPPSPISEDLKANVRQLPLYVDSTSELEQMVEQEHPRERSGEDRCGSCDVCREEGEWIILDMLDDHAFSSILRILHRQASHPISSSFVPSSSIITLSKDTTLTTATRGFVSYDAIPYPEWRVNTVENARKAGMGDVGKPMAWVLWTEEIAGETLLGNIRHRRQAFSRKMQYKTGMIPLHMYGSEDESDDDSEMEWEGWVRDLERQSQVRERSRKAKMIAPSRQASMSSPPPSPPISEASPSGSPRVGSPSFSHLAAEFHPHARYPNVGNIIQAGGLHRSLEKGQNATFSTVSVGKVPSPRRRSSTLSSELAQREQDRPSTSAGGTRASVGLQWPPRTPIRHVHSSSNLKKSSPHGSDESTVHAGPSYPKRQSAFMRGVSLRAGKIVKGLESAIDFVDG